MSQSKLVVISAARNEDRSVALVLAEVARAREELEAMGLELELLVVDDSDTPATAEELTSEAKIRELRLTVLEGPGQGIGAAFVAGFRYALDELSPDLLATIDCDGQHDATQLPSLVRAKLEGDEILVIGSRFVPGSTVSGLTRSRRMASKVGNQLMRRLSGERLPDDATTSFRVFEPELARRFLRHGLVAGCNGYSFFSLFVLFAVMSGPVAEVPIDFRPRLVGSSNLTLQECWQFARGLPEIHGRASQWGRLTSDDPFGESSDTGCLDELSNMPNYARWIVDEMAPWLHGSVLEVGAGIGTMTPYLAASPDVTSVCALEPDADAFERLVERCAGIPGVTARRGTLDTISELSDAPDDPDVPDTSGEPAGAGARETSFDTIVYINCLEHILDEEVELRAAAQRLRTPDAHLVVFSPALESLYGELDRISGHWRRYSRRSMLAALRGAGLSVVHARYVDLLSIAPYWLSSRVLGHDTIGAASADFYDRYYVRAARALHRGVHSPLGKSMLCVAVRE